MDSWCTVSKIRKDILTHLSEIKLSKVEVLTSNPVIHPKNLGMTLDDQPPATTKSSSRISVGCINTSIRKWSSYSSAITTCPWLVDLNLPSELCSSFRMQQLGCSSASSSSPTQPRSSTPYTGYWWLLKSNSRHWYFPSVLQMATSRIWSNHTL